MRFAPWINKTTNARLEYVIFTAFPRQPWLGERPSVLDDTNVACVAYIWKRSTVVDAETVLTMLLGYHDFAPYRLLWFIAVGINLFLC